MMGMLWQLLWMGELPIGATKFPDGSLGALISTYSFLNLKIRYPQQTDLLLTLCLIIGVLSAYIGGQFISDKRKFHLHYLNIADKFAAKGHPQGIESVFLLGVTETFLSGGLFATFVYLISNIILSWTVVKIPTYWNGLFINVKVAMMGIAVAVMVDLFWNRKTILALLLGVGLSILLCIYL
jgi:mannose/fructose/N-acetylgalactosamine-specific phosphotransferase system component IIC